MTGAAGYCATVPDDLRVTTRDKADALADADPRTEGMRIRIWCQGDPIPDEVLNPTS